MKGNEFSNDVRQFIFDYIDSVEQLEVLSLLRQDSSKWWTALEISTHLRSTPHSVDSRFSQSKLKSLILETHPTIESCYRYKVNPEVEATIQQLLNEYKVRKQAVLELIFSPIKRGRHFADAFVFGKNSDGKKGDHG